MSEQKSDFAAQLTELEAITTWFEAESVDLGQAVTKFERGMELAAGLNKELEAVENRVEVIKRKFSGDDATAAPAPIAADDNQQLF